MGVALRPGHLDAMARHFELVLETNQKFNLTRITEPTLAATRLYADSLAPAAWIKNAGITVKTVLDIGTGAGFPAVPLAIVCPKWKVTAIDSTGKKARFVEDAGKQLSISNLRCRQVRAGEASFKQRFDVITAKAVGSLEVCVQIASANLATNGHLLVFKGRNLSDSEQKAGVIEAENRRMQLVDVCDYDIPCGADVLEHSLIVYQRVG
ncbi:MAG: 16S rRNA (guanine(527)-N(7))-methyltransferase RsmG [Planctomycetes bacterium]|nr:16S rRNA (guanine(527)-N(7))-methyltransferase RsmG [Planctomycetota bacterium]